MNFVSVTYCCGHFIAKLFKTINNYKQSFYLYVKNITCLRLFYWPCLCVLLSGLLMYLYWWLKIIPIRTITKQTIFKDRCLMLRKTWTHKHHKFSQQTEYVGHASLISSSIVFRWRPSLCFRAFVSLRNGS